MRYRRQEARYPTGAAIRRLTADLGLPEVGQDWELEAADSRRVAEFLDYYETQQLNDDERFALMSLIIASFDQRISASPDDVLQKRIVDHLTVRFDLLNYLVQYWALPDEDSEDEGFPFTPIARQIMQSECGDRACWPRTPFAVMRSCKLLRGQGVYNSVEIADNRDGTFGLSWSKIEGRESGSCEFSSIEEATAFARCQFDVAPDDWRKLS